MKQTNSSLLTLLIAATVLLPTGATFAVVSIQEKEAAKEQLDTIIDEAVTHYRQRSGIAGVVGKTEQTKAQLEERIATLSKEKLLLRRKIVVQRDIIDGIEARYGLEIESKEHIQALVIAQKDRIQTMLQEKYARSAMFAYDGSRMAIVDAVFGDPEMVSRERLLEQTQMALLKDLVAAEVAMWSMETLMIQREDALAAYWEAEYAYAEAVETIEKNAARLEEVQRITAEVHAQVLKLQGELARIDAKLRAKAERVLIEKGILDSAVGAGSDASYKPMFTWPVFGRVSAGFHQESYKSFFGVAHEGTDIVVGQGTPVAAAADGIVFLVRDGGQTGYTYILIGHRSGYATLYGHLSETSVRAGQEVRAGDIIGLSGGTPGTYGAGPMTTAAHLHFEVIQAGVNIDPLSVLP